MAPLRQWGQTQHLLHVVHDFDTPLDTDSWKYVDNYFKNPGDDGMGFSNNHTHLQKYKGDYYLFYHNMCLQEHKGTNGGFRSLCVNKLKVDEKNVKLEKRRARH